VYFATILRQCWHLIISNLPQFGHLKRIVPIVFVMRFLQDEHINFSDIISGIKVLFIKIVDFYFFIKIKLIKN
jgi:hypothetical protein